MLKVNKFRTDRVGPINWWKYNERSGRLVAVRSTNFIEIIEDYLLFKKVSNNDGGLYVAKISNGDEAFFNLIVRHCPANRFLPPFCGQNCPFVCLHNGVCDDKTGQCHCPVGTYGEYCQFICDRNTFGSHCQFGCGLNGCSRLQFCKSKVGCHCPNGYHGLECNQPCSMGYFGPDCKIECKCQSRTTPGLTSLGFNTCDRFTGKCNDNAICQNGFTGISCQEKCPKNKFGQNCIKYCNCFENQTCNHISGTCPPIDTDPYGCNIGFTGDDCYTPLEQIKDFELEEETPFFTGTMVGIFVTIGFMIVVASVMVVYRKVKYPDARMKRPEGKGTKRMAWTDS